MTGKASPASGLLPVRQGILSVQKKTARCRPGRFVGRPLPAAHLPCKRGRKQWESPARRAMVAQGRRASSGFSLVTGIRSFFDTPSHSRIGLATKIDDSVPTTMPISMVTAKPCTAVPP